MIFVKESDLYEIYEMESEPYDDERLGRAVVMFSDKTSQTDYPTILRIERKFTDLENFEEFVNRSILRLNLEHNNILQMIDYSYKPDNEEMTSFTVNGFFENCETDLQKQIELNVYQKKKFSDIDIFNLIKHCVFGLAFLQLNKSFHGDLRYCIIY